MVRGPVFPCFGVFKGGGGGLFTLFLNTGSSAPIRITMDGMTGCPVFRKSRDAICPWGAVHLFHEFESHRATAPPRAVLLYSYRYRLMRGPAICDIVRRSEQMQLNGHAAAVGTGVPGGAGGCGGDNCSS